MNELVGGPPDASPRLGWIAGTFALGAGVLAGVALDLESISESYSAWWSIYWRFWGDLFRGGHVQADLVTFPAGAALACWLGAHGLTRFGKARSRVLVIAVASQAGALVVLWGSVLFDCLYYGLSNRGCSGTGPGQLFRGTLVVWGLLAVVTLLVAFPAMWLARRSRNRPSPANASC